MIVIVIIVLLLLIVLYQSRHESFDLKLYLQRMTHLLMLIFNYLKSIGLDAAQKFQQINWDLTHTS